MTLQSHILDPKLDLILERVIDVSKELVWRAWTQPEHVKHWFTPAPWVTTECEIDLRPGGMFRFVMRSPEGQSFPHIGCFLEIIENKKLVWTDTLLPGYRPSENPFFTAMILLEPQGSQTQYTAIAQHKNEEDKLKHESMGFREGWGKCLDQLISYATTL